MRASCKSVKAKCLSRVSSKIVLQKSQERASYKSVKKACEVRASKPQECPTRVSNKKRPTKV